MIDGRRLHYTIVFDESERREAERAVRRSAERLELALQAAQQGIYDLDLRTGEAVVSPEYARMLGHEPETFVETNAAWIERLHPDDREKVARTFRDYVEGRLPEYRVEFRQRTRDGRWKWILSLGRIVERDADGRPRRMLGTHTDITERVEAETARRAAESRLQFALERSSTGGWALDLDDHSTVRTLEHDRIFGYDTLLPRWTYEQFLEHVLPEDRAHVDATFQDAVRRGGDWTFECRIRRRDGAVRWIWAAGGHEPVVAGGRRRMAGLMQDITERKTAVENLRTSERQFRAFFEGSLYGMMLAAEDGRILRVNPEACRLLGRSEEELLRSGRDEMVDPSDARLAVLLEERKRTGRTRGEVRLRRGDGGTIEVEVASTYFDTPEGVRASIVLRDVSERNRLVEGLRLQAARAEALLELSARAEQLAEEEFLQLALEKAEELTGSHVGFLHFVNDGGRSIELAAWSRRTLETYCHATHDRHYPIEQAGIWADALRTAAPVVVNDYPTHPGRRGLPEGHAALRAFVSVPVLEGANVVMLAGVGNKELAYTPQDVLTVQLVANLAWRIIRQRRSLAEAREATANLDAVIRAAPVGIVTLGEGLRILSANAAAAAILGGTAEELGALDLRRLSPPSAEGLVRAAEDALARNEPRREEARFATSLGREVWIDVQFIPFLRAQERRLLGLFTDIRERMETTARLRLQAAALDAAANTVVITDDTGKIEWVNDAFSRSTGYSRGEAIGSNPRVLKSGRHPAKFYAEMWDTIRSGRVWRGEFRNRRKDGSDLDEDATITPVRGHDGTITHYVAIKQDITERKRLEQQLLRSQRMEGIGLLAGGIAHDLNNILTPIQIGVDLLRKRTTEPRALRTLDVLESSARRGAGIVRQVLTFSRGVSGERVPLRPRDVVREIVSILEETFPRQIQIRREVPADVASFLGDPAQLHQVLLNLAVNARDAMPEGGQLVFRAAMVEVAETPGNCWGEVQRGRYVRIAVADTGSGIPPEVLERIFDPFFTTKPQGKGTGLGLPTVLGIVRSHGGFLTVESRPGEGTEFRVHLPALATDAAEAGGLSARADIDGAGQTILVCDDEPMLREIACALLRDVGFQVVEASNGVEAVQRYQENRERIHGVLIDIMMPLMSGDRAVSEMLRDSPRLPVVFMSGLMDEASLLQAMETVPQVGGRLLKKPFTDYELFAALREAGLGRAAPPRPLPV